MIASNRQLVLRARRAGMPHASDFAVQEAPVPEPNPGQFVVRNLYASLDPALRQRLTLTDSYVPRIELDEVLTATTVAVVTASQDPKYPVGQHIVGHHGIANYWLTSAAPTTRAIDPSAVESLSQYLSVLGPTGLTAYFGITRVARPRAGDTVLVSAAAGAVGSIAGQIAKLSGCRVIGIAGGAEKVERLTAEYGFDAGIDYRGHNLDSLTGAIRAAAPEGIDVVFENVGGIHLDATIDCVNERGRIAVCGLISQYNATEPPPPITNLFKLVARSIRMEGFIVRNYSAEYSAAAETLAGWVRDGRIHFREAIHDGLDAGPEAFLSLFTGDNQGKVMLRLDPTT